MNISVKRFVSGLKLPVGKSHRCNCPECGGQYTFTVTNVKGQLKWNCYKAGCAVGGGSMPTMLTAQDIRDILTGSSEKQQGHQEWIMPPHIVLASRRSETDTFCAQWGLDPNKLYYDVKDNRVVFPIRDGGTLVDGAGRSLDSNPKMKWKRYAGSRLPYVIGKGTVAIAVEDCISAHAIADEGGVGVALLGTALTDEARDLLMTYDKCAIALDPDAKVKALKMRRHFHDDASVMVMNLSDDPKYRVPSDVVLIREMIHETSSNGNDELRGRVDHGSHQEGRATPEGLD